MSFSDSQLFYQMLDNLSIITPMEVWKGGRIASMVAEATLFLSVATGCRPANVTDSLINNPPGIVNPETRLKDSIEARFGVQILTLRQLYAQKGVAFPYDSDDVRRRLHGEAPESWSEENLQILDEFLNALPERFHKPNSRGERLRIVLSNRDCHCAFEGEREQYEVQIRPERLDPANKQEGFVVFAHEATHAQVPVRGYTRTYSEVERDYVDVEESIWYDKLNSILKSTSHSQTRNILGERYRRATDGFYDRLPSFTFETRPDAQGWERILATVYPPEELERYNFFSRFSGIAYPFTFPTEFVAFMAENWVKGIPYFERHFSELFNESELAQVKSFVREDIFSGKEYAQNPFQEPK